VIFHWNRQNGTSSVIWLAQHWAKSTCSKFVFQSFGQPRACLATSVTDTWEWRRLWFWIIWVWGATISRLLKIIGLFCKGALWKRLCSAKETWTFKESTNRSHPIPGIFSAIYFSDWMIFWPTKQLETKHSGTHIQIWHRAHVFSNYPAKLNESWHTVCQTMTTYIYIYISIFFFRANVVFAGWYSDGFRLKTY